MNLIETLVDTVSKVHRGVLMRVPDNAVLQHAKSGDLMITFSRGSAFYRRLFQVNPDRDNAFSLLVRKGLCVDIFSIQQFCEDMLLKPDKCVVYQVGGKSGWWQNSKCCVVVCKDGSVQFMSREKILSMAVVSLLGDDNVPRG